MNDNVDNFYALDREPDTLSLADVEQEFEELTARFNRCKQELEDSKASHRATATKQERRVSFNLPTPSQPSYGHPTINSSASLFNRDLQSEHEELTRRIKELERSEVE